MANVHPRADDIRPYEFYQGGIEIVGGDVLDAPFFAVTANLRRDYADGVGYNPSTAVRRSPSPTSSQTNVEHKGG